MTQQPAQAERTDFAQEVCNGLSADPKRLPSKYFYDAEGDQLFQRIMRMPEYYLTDCEYEILDRYKAAILDTFGGRPFELVELGAGDGYKTKVLLEYFLEQKTDFRYLPVDISTNVLIQLEQDLLQRWPDLPIESLQGDYFSVLEDLGLTHQTRKMVLYLGSTIGNLGADREREFLREVSRHMHTGDLLLIGFDLRKDPRVILDAYNDPAGITAAFNLNLLHRINRELEGDFVVDQFKHWETYNPLNGEARSYLVSLTDQQVRIGAAERSFRFRAWEAIAVELSKKYTLPQTDELAKATGFRPVDHFTDRRDYFLDALWEKP